MPIFNGPACRGSKVLGTGCGTCERCKYEDEFGPVRPKVILVPKDSSFVPIPVDGKFIEKHSPTAGGYYVVYEDGYKSFSPAEAFESGYSKIES